MAFEKICLPIGLMVASLIAGSLSACAHGAPSTAAAPSEEKPVTTKPSAMPFMNVFASSNDFATTLEKLTAGVEARGLKTFAIIDHAKGAASIDQTLAPTTLVIFGNPKGGTPLMQAAQTMGFDLPLKALVYETADGAVMIAVSDVAALFAAHSDAAPPPPVSAIADMLQGLADEAGS